MDARHSGHGQVKSYSHQDAFFSGTIEKGLGSLQGSEMGWSFKDDFLLPMISKAVAPDPAPAPIAMPTTTIPAKPDMTMTYIKYGAIAVGGLFSVILLMKLMKSKTTTTTVKA